MPARIDRGTSTARRACRLRGWARNDIPNALAKQTRAKAPVRANMAAAMGSISFKNRLGSWKLKKRL